MTRLGGDVTLSLYLLNFVPYSLPISLYLLCLLHMYDRTAYSDRLGRLPDYYFA